MCYVQGGTPLGAVRRFPGCSDTRPPLGDIALELPQSLYFAGDATFWGGGGGAHITLDAAGEPTKARAYLISLPQFEEVVIQEDVRTGLEVAIDLKSVKAMGHIAVLPEGPYSELIYCGEQDGYPILSFTKLEPPDVFTLPSAAYLRMISGGLQESHGMVVDDVTAYLIDKPGIADNITLEDLRQTLI